jgi:hypothetical protein
MLRLSARTIVNLRALSVSRSSAAAASSLSSLARPPAVTVAVAGSRLSSNALSKAQQLNNKQQQLHTSAVVADMATGAEDVETTEKLVKKATRARKPKASTTGTGEEGTVKAKPKKSKKATSSKGRSKKAAAVGEDGEVKVKKPKKKAAPSQLLAKHVKGTAS